MARKLDIFTLGPKPDPPKHACPVCGGWEWWYLPSWALWLCARCTPPEPHGPEWKGPQR